MLDNNKMLFAFVMGGLLNFYGIWLLHRSMQFFDRGNTKRGRWNFGVGVIDISIGIYLLTSVLITTLNRGLN